MAYGCVIGEHVREASRIQKNAIAKNTPLILKTKMKIPSFSDGNRLFVCCVYGLCAFKSKRNKSFGRNHSVSSFAFHFIFFFRLFGGLIFVWICVQFARIHKYESMQWLYSFHYLCGNTSTDHLGNRKRNTRAETRGTRGNVTGKRLSKPLNDMNLLSACLCYTTKNYKFESNRHFIPVKLPSIDIRSELIQHRAFACISTKLNYL